MNEPSVIPREDLIEWVCERWHAEVKNRSLVNVNRRPLDDAWRQMLRHLGINDEARLGPRHDELVQANPQLFRERGLRSSEPTAAALIAHLHKIGEHYTANNAEKHLATLATPPERAEQEEARTRAPQASGKPT
jgi:hypothetical protein